MTPDEEIEFWRRKVIAQPEDDAAIVRLGLLLQRAKETEPAELPEDVKEEEPGFAEFISVNQSRLRDGYLGRIREWAEDIRQECEDGEYESREQLNDRLWEQVDGCDMVIYTYMNHAVLMASDNAGACIEELGADSAVRDGDVHWAGMAFMAVYRDLCEAIEVDPYFEDDGHGDWIDPNADEDDEEELTEDPDEYDQIKNGDKSPQFQA